MAEKVGVSTHLKFGKLLNADGVLFWDYTDMPVIEAQDDDLVHTVTDIDVNRPDLLAFDYYGDEVLWWVILLANNKNTINQLSIGEELIIPSPRYVKSTLLALAGGG